MRGLATIIALGLALGGPACDGRSSSSPPRPNPGQIIDLNRATLDDLEALPGIGVKHARSIMASRNARGGRFTRLEDLLAIDGIGTQTIERIRPYVVVRQ